MAQVPKKNSIARIASVVCQFKPAEVKNLLECGTSGTQHRLVSPLTAALGLATTPCRGFLESNRGFLSFGVLKPGGQSVEIPCIQSEGMLLFCVIRPLEIASEMIARANPEDFVSEKNQTLIQTGINIDNQTTSPLNSGNLKVVDIIADFHALHFDSDETVNALFGKIGIGGIGDFIVSSGVPEAIEPASTGELLLADRDTSGDGLVIHRAIGLSEKVHRCVLRARKVDKLSEDPAIPGVFFAPDKSGTYESVKHAIEFLYTGRIRIQQPASPYRFRMSDKNRLELMYELGVAWGCEELQRRVVETMAFAAASGWVGNDVNVLSLISKTQGFSSGPSASMWSTYILGMVVITQRDPTRAKIFIDALATHGIKIIDLMNKLFPNTKKSKRSQESKSPPTKPKKPEESRKTEELAAAAVVLQAEVPPPKKPRKTEELVPPSKAKQPAVVVAEKKKKKKKAEEPEGSPLLIVEEEEQTPAIREDLNLSDESSSSEDDSSSSSDGESESSSGDELEPSPVLERIISPPVTPPKATAQKRIHSESPGKVGGAGTKRRNKRRPPALEKARKEAFKLGVPALSKDKNHHVRPNLGRGPAKLPESAGPQAAGKPTGAANGSADNHRTARAASPAPQTPDSTVQAFLDMFSAAF